MTATPLGICTAAVGEGPLYIASEDTLYWTDIPLGHVWRRALRTGQSILIDVGEPVSSIAPIEGGGGGGGGFLLAGAQGLLLLSDWSATPVLWRAIEEGLPTRFNDGKCAPDGSFVAGTTALDRSRAGTLYRVDHDGRVYTLLHDVGMSNGLDWSPDDRFFYHVDSRAQRVTRYEWDADEGVPRRGAPFIEIAPGDGTPDGLTVDSEGHVWLALWGGGQVRRYDPSGRHVETVEVPTPNVTSCAFGGANLEELFITTAAAGLPPERADAAVGDVFVVETKTSGRTRPPFRSVGHLYDASDAVSRDQ